jgi:hypothetical protein
MRLEHLAADFFDTICGPSIIHPAAHYRKIVQNIVQCLTSNAYNPEGESYATGSSDVEGIFTSLLDGGFDWTVCGYLELFMSNIRLICFETTQSEMLRRSRTRPRTLVMDSRVSPLPGSTTHKHRSRISPLTLHIGRALGRSFRSSSLLVPFSCTVSPSCFPLLSFIPLSPFCNSRPLTIHKSGPTLSSFDPFRITSPAPTIHCYCFHIASLSSHSTLHTLTMFSLV